MAHSAKLCCGLENGTREEMCNLDPGLYSAEFANISTSRKPPSSSSSLLDKHKAMARK